MKVISKSVAAQLAMAVTSTALGCSSPSTSASAPAQAVTVANPDAGADASPNANADASSNANAQGDAGAAVVLTGAPIVATAAFGTGEALLGTPADTTFNQTSGAAIFKPRVDGSGALVETRVDQITTGWVEAQTTIELAANLKGWGLASADLDASSTHRYMSMRAYQVDYYEDVDLTAVTGPAPQGAVYFVSKIFFGHSYEALFSGDSSTFTAAVAATLPAASGSINAKAQQLGLTASDVGRGLQPKDGTAIFAASQSDVSASYVASGPSVPIYVEYRLLPGVAAPPGAPIAWSSPLRATFAIDEIDVFHNGSTLDARNTSWTMNVTCKVNGAVVASNLPLWTQSAVSAGGSQIASDGSGPQDPNKGSTNTYGRYASLPFSTSLPVADGDNVECDINGQRTDTSSPVALPPVTIHQTVSAQSPVDDRAANFDSGNGLDYGAHYTLTYAATR